MLSLNKYLEHPSLLGESLLHHFGSWLPDRAYLRLLYYLKVGHRLNLKQPMTFGEKIQWLKLNDRRPEYTIMVDKNAVKKYVAERIGSEYIIPTLGIWKSTKDIEWEMLPKQFVLKTTHGGGSTGVVICIDKDAFDKQKAIKKINSSLNTDIYCNLREWPYKDVPKQIIAEQFITPDDGQNELIDYKWYCFNGIPRFCQVIKDRYSKETIDFFNTNWDHQDFIGLNPSATFAFPEPERPAHLDAQIHIASLLAKGLPFARIDLFETGNRVYFGEITFYPMSGLGSFKPERFNYILGQMITLPEE